MHLLLSSTVVLVASLIANILSHVNAFLANQIKYNALYATPRKGNEGILPDSQLVIPSSLLRMSSDVDDGGLSKLLGKRHKLRQERKNISSKYPDEYFDGEGLPHLAFNSSSSYSALTTNQIAQDVSSMYGGNVNAQIFEKMPKLQTTRSVSSTELEESNEKTDSESKEKFVDFMADYDDENDMHIPNRIGFGTMAWGDPTFGFSSGKKQLKKEEAKAGLFCVKDLHKVYKKLMTNGITFLDTSEGYGISGRDASLSSEHIVGKFMNEGVNNVNPIISSSMRSPWMAFRKGGLRKDGIRFGRNGILNAIDASCERIGVNVIDLYQIPSPRSFLYSRTVIDGICEALDKGVINEVGVMDMNKLSMTRFASKLRKRGYSLTSNTFEFSLINRNAWKSGLIKACKELGVIPIAHMPLGGRLASGIYTSVTPTWGRTQQKGKQQYDFKIIDKYTMLHTMLITIQNKVKNRLKKVNREIKHNSKYKYNVLPVNMDVTTAQIAINYVVGKGCVPIPGITHRKEAEQLLGCLGWSLTNEEIQMLDDAADMSDEGITV